MSTQPEALRLADAMDAVNTNNADSLLVQMAARSAAAELRRLHAENEALQALARRWLAVRSGHIYIEHLDGEFYMADDDGGKYYTDLRDMEMDIDEAIAKAEGREA